MASEEVSYFDVMASNGVYFALKHQPPLQQAFWLRFQTPIILKIAESSSDPNHESDSGSIAIDWFEPSVERILCCGIAFERGQ